MSDSNLKNRLINKIKESDDPSLLEKAANLFELQEPEVSYKETKYNSTVTKSIDPLLEMNIVRIKELMLAHGVEMAYAFGSAVKHNMKQHSDMDFVIRFHSGLDYETYANNYFNLLNALRNLLKIDVDLLTEETLSNPYLIQSINENKLQIL